MINVGIIGATGYAGNELVRILTGHKDAKIVWYGSRSYIDKKYAEVYQNMFQIVDDECLDDNMEELAEQADVIFTATPQGFCASMMNEEILSKTKIIDLSADYRIKDAAVYEKWYGIEHKSPQFIGEAVYGGCEEGEIGRESGLLHHLFDPNGVSAGEGRTDRYEYIDHRRQVRDFRCGQGNQIAEPLLRGQ